MADKETTKQEKEKKLKLPIHGLLSPREALESYKPEPPVVRVAKLSRVLMRLLIAGYPAVFHYGFDKREMEGRQVLILAQHASRDDPYYIGKGYPFVQPNAVMSMHNVLIPVMFRLLLKDGVVLKALYEPDIGAMRDLLRLHRKGASFVIFPEGIESTDGTTQPIHPATARLIKKLGMDTVLCTSHGAFLSTPRFDTEKRKGRIEYNFEMLFRKEEFKKMSEEELYSRLLEKFRYNDFAWNAEKQYKYKGKVPLAHGLDNILFICPRCGKQFTMRVEGERLVCDCGSVVTIDDRYNMIPDDMGGSGGKDGETAFPFKRIDQWYRWQQDLIAEEVKRDDFAMSEEVTYLKLNLDDLRKGRYIYAGEGRIELDRERLRYTGTKDGGEVDLEFEISRMPSATISKDQTNQFYYDGEYYRFVNKHDRRRCVKIMLAVEALHEMGDPDRRRAREDVRENDR